MRTVFRSKVPNPKQAGYPHEAREALKAQLRSGAGGPLAARRGVKTPCRMPLRNDRRRRVLLDEAHTSTSDGPSASSDDDAAVSTKPKVLSYAPSVQRDRQRCVSDLLPSKLFTISAVTLGCLVVIAVLEVAHCWAGSVASLLGMDEASALALEGPRNVTQWFASMLLGFESLLALFVYSLRRHRVDDYNGRYRVWIWVAAACLVASLAETTDIGLVARAVCQRLASLSSLSAGFVWLSVASVVLGLVALRLTIEVRRSRLALSGLWLAVACFLISAAANSDRPWALAQATRPLVTRGSWLAGYVFLMATSLLYARHVALEMEGRVRESRPKRKLVKAAGSNDDGSRQVRIDQPQQPAPHFRTDLEPAKPAAGPQTTRSQDSSVSEKSVPTVPLNAPTDNSAGRELSRADRKRLRREARRAA